MKVVKKDLPTEGVKIAGVHFMPGVPQDVDKAFGKILTERKGFRQVKGGTKNNTEVTDDAEG